MNLEDNRRQEAQRILEGMGCGKVTLGEDFKVTSIENDFFTKEIIWNKIEDKNKAFIVAMKSPKGGIVLEKDETVQILKYSTNLISDVFSTFSDKGVKFIFEKVLQNWLQKK